LFPIPAGKIREIKFLPTRARKTREIIFNLVPEKIFENRSLYRTREIREIEFLLIAGKIRKNIFHLVPVLKRLLCPR